jgi:hypothetical protein
MLNKENRLRLFVYRVLKIFEPKGDEVKGNWRKSHNKKLQWSVLLTKYYSDVHIKRNEMGGVCDTMDGEGEVCLGF